MTRPGAVRNRSAAVANRSGAVLNQSGAVLNRSGAVVNRSGGVLNLPGASSGTLRAGFAKSHLTGLAGPQQPEAPKRQNFRENMVFRSKLTTRGRNFRLWTNFEISKFSTSDL